MFLPKILEGQFAVLIAHGATGQVHDKNGVLINSVEQEMFTTFESLESAKEFVNKIGASNVGFEFCIYNSVPEIIELVKAPLYSRY